MEWHSLKNVHGCTMIYTNESTYFHFSYQLIRKKSISVLYGVLLLENFVSSRTGVRGMLLVMRVRARLRRGMKVRVLECFGNSIDFTIETSQLAKLN